MMSSCCDFPTRAGHDSARPILQVPAHARIGNLRPSRGEIVVNKRGDEVSLSADDEQRETWWADVLRRQVQSNINQRRQGGRFSRSLTSWNDLVPVMSGRPTPPTGRDPQRQAVTPSASAALCRRSMQPSGSADCRPTTKRHLTLGFSRSTVKRRRRPGQQSLSM